MASLLHVMLTFTYFHSLYKGVSYECIMHPYPVSQPHNALLYEGLLRVLCVTVNVQHHNALLEASNPSKSTCFSHTGLSVSSPFELHRSFSLVSKSCDIISNTAIRPQSARNQCSLSHLVLQTAV